MKTINDLFIMEVAVNAIKLKLGQEITEWEQSVIDEYTQAVEENDGVRICDDCGKLIVEGYVWGDGEHIECEACLNNSTTKEEYNKAYENDEVYWTQWEE